MRDQRQADHVRLGRVLDQCGVYGVHRRSFLQHWLQRFRPASRDAHVIELSLAPAKDAAQPAMCSHAANTMARLTSSGGGNLLTQSRNSEHRLARTEERRVGTDGIRKFKYGVSPRQ